ncbi:MAG: hypothetical protein GQ570_08520 [Helicobacteraceae bacterium]|nr:hypothetical protein [Helicobacteraceae bacterium]
MSKELKRWTKHFMEKGYDTLEARDRAKARMNFKKEVEQIDTTKNETDKGVYNV